MLKIYEEYDEDQYVEDKDPDYVIDYYNGHYRLIDPDGVVIKNDFSSYEEAQNYLDPRRGLVINELEDEESEEEVKETTPEDKVKEAPIEYVVIRYYDSYGYSYIMISNSDQDIKDYVHYSTTEIYSPDFAPNLKSYTSREEAAKVANRFNAISKKNKKNYLANWKVARKWW